VLAGRAAARLGERALRCIRVGRQGHPNRPCRQRRCCHAGLVPCQLIAKELGQTLVAPVIAPALPRHRRHPEEVYAGMLEGIARSLKAGGFKTSCFIADHAGSPKPQTEVAERLSREWGKQDVRVIDVSDYYADAAETDYLKSQGET
jgi:creatinine amidohydrolase